MPGRTWIGILAAAAVLALPAEGKLSEARKQELIRALTAEFSTARIVIPRSKKPLELTAKGTIDSQEWGEAMNDFGVAAREGDLVQITKLDFKGSKLVVELNHGIKGGRKWWHRVQVSGGMNRHRTLGDTAATHAPGGTTLAVVFDGPIPDQTPDELKKYLRPLLDFEVRTATELYLEKIEPEYREAIEQNEVLTGMDKEMVLLAKNRPDRKVRDMKDGVETEDWLYGKPPGDVVFITFQDGKVTSVRHEHANIGGEVKQTPPLDF